jgi:hypothetical protein
MIATSCTYGSCPTERGGSSGYSGSAQKLSDPPETMTDQGWTYIPRKNERRKKREPNNSKKPTKQQKKKTREKSPSTINKFWNDRLKSRSHAAASNLKLRGTPDKIAYQQALLNSRGLYRFKAEGDGNCGTRAISVIQSGSPDNHQKFRNKAVDWLLENPDKYMGMVIRDDDETQEEAWSKRLAILRTSGEWADHLLLLGLAGANNLTIHILPCEEGKVTDPITVGGSEETHVYVLYMTNDKREGMHFDPALSDPNLAVQVKSVKPCIQLKHTLTM